MNYVNDNDTSINIYIKRKAMFNQVTGGNKMRKMK